MKPKDCKGCLDLGDYNSKLRCLIVNAPIKKVERCPKDSPTMRMIGDYLDAHMSVCLTPVIMKMRVILGDREEPLDGDAVDLLCSAIKQAVNSHEGNS